ncbi:MULTISPECIES: hypothetical protein [Thalassospira]|nr:MULTISPECIES: hypothetical protein [Thalassospira]OCK09015.1 hypothetical protein KO164_3194 [Thalassospira sp. KO164]PXX36466.1 hypothetical protein C7967_101864 [Thalassospira sp. 11-3]
MRLGLRLQMINKQEGDDDMAKGKKANGRLKKGYRYAKGGRVVKAKGRK